MRPNFAVLLMVFAIAAVASSSSSSSSSSSMLIENCTSGDEVTDIYMESPCPDSRKVLRKLRMKRRELMRRPSVDKLRSYATAMCREWMPEQRRCFAEAVSDCDPVERQYLIGLSQNTGTICTPNGTDISPWMEHLLGKLTDDDVADDPMCLRSMRRPRGMKDCYEGTLQILNLTESSFLSFRYSATVRELVPVDQRFSVTYLDCVAESIGDEPNRCRNWRRYIWGRMVFHCSSYLGLHFNYTTEQIDTIFEFPEADFDRRRWVGSFLNPLE